LVLVLVLVMLNAHSIAIRNPVIAELKALFVYSPSSGCLGEDDGAQDDGEDDVGGDTGDGDAHTAGTCVRDDGGDDDAQTAGAASVPDGESQMTRQLKRNISKMSVLTVGSSDDEGTPHEDHDGNKQSCDINTEQGCVGDINTQVTELSPGGQLQCGPARDDTPCGMNAASTNSDGMEMEHDENRGDGMPHAACGAPQDHAVAGVKLPQSTDQVASVALDVTKLPMLVHLRNPAALMDAIDHAPQEPIVPFTDTTPDVMGAAAAAQHEPGSSCSDMPAIKGGAVPHVPKPDFMRAAQEVAARMLGDPVAIDAKTQHALRTEKKEEAQQKRQTKAAMSRSVKESKSKKQKTDDAPSGRGSKCHEECVGAAAGSAKAAPSGTCGEGHTTPWTQMMAMHSKDIEQLPKDARPDPDMVKGCHSYTIVKPGHAGRCSVLSAPRWLCVVVP
jgi:hypothetical protein